MIPLALFRSPAFCGTNVMTLFLYGALGGSLFFLPMNLMQVQGFTATQAGAAMIPSALLPFLLSRWARGGAARGGGKPPLLVGAPPPAPGVPLFLLPGARAAELRRLFP